MKDETKHKLAKELSFFFKWLMIGLIPCIISFVVIICGVLFQIRIIPRNIENQVEYAAYLINSFFPIVVLLFAYGYRLYKWIMKWK